MVEEQPQEKVEQTVVQNEPTAIELAEKLHLQIKSENDRHEALLVRDENLKAEQMLGGQSVAGVETAVVEPEQIIKDRCNKLLEDTGLSI